MVLHCGHLHITINRLLSYMYSQPINSGHLCGKAMWLPFTALTTKCKSTKELCEKKVKRNFSLKTGEGRGGRKGGGGGRRGGGGGGEGGGDCGSGTGTRISWVMVHRLQDISKGLEEADYSLHCSSALKSKIETARNTEQKKNKKKVYTLVWGKREKIRQRRKSLRGRGGRGGRSPGKF